LLFLAALLIRITLKQHHEFLYIDAATLKGACGVVFYNSRWKVAGDRLEQVDCLEIW
jgi:hypothetical protein